MGLIVPFTNSNLMMNKKHHLNSKKDIIIEYVTSYIDRDIDLNKLITILSTIDKWAETEAAFHKNLNKVLKTLESTVREPNVQE